MKSKFIGKEFKYDGSQLRPLFAYLESEILGDSIVSWVGPCDIELDKIIDGEDLLVGSQICGDKMLHFIVEKFDIELFSAVALQRLMAELVCQVVRDQSQDKAVADKIVRRGDDLYFQNKKLNISIASKSPTSCMIHFAVNITNSGTPVPTLSLEDLQLDEQSFACEVMARFCKEVEDMIRATQKVRPL